MCTLTNDVIMEHIELASSILSECLPNYKRPNIVDISVSRAKSYWGQVRRLPGGYGIRVSKTFEKIPSTLLFRKRLISCMIHELIHTQEGCMNHKANFKKAAALVNKKYPQYDVSTSTSDEEYGVASYQLKAKWVVTCTHCGQKYYYQRRPKYYNNINEHMFCGKCKRSKMIVEAVV